MATVVINEFSNGMVGDDRSTSTNVFSLIKQFNPVSRKNRLTPYSDVQTGDASASTHQITDFINYAGLTGTLYGLGNDATNVKLFTKDSLTSGSSWSSFSNNTGSLSGLPQAGVFVQYKGFAFGGHTSDGTIWRCDIGAGTVFANANGTLSGGQSAIPTAAVVHSKDDILYVGHGNSVSKNNNNSWTPSALLLPTKYTVVSLCEFNDFLAIGCNGTDGKSVVFLWNRDSSLTTISANIDWGVGTLGTLQQVEEYLIGVSIVGTSGLYPKMVFRKYLSGAGGVVFNELFASSIVGLGVNAKSQKVSNRMYFAGGITIDGVLHNGIFAIQRPTGKTEFSVWIDQLPNNDTAIAALALGSGDFIFINDYVYISYQDSGYKLTFTNSNATAYTATAYCETTWNPNMPVMDRTKKKQVTAASLSHLPISVNGGQVVLDYKVDGGAWTTVITNTTVGSVTTEYNAKPFAAGREYKFRIKGGGASSVGLVEPIELKYSYEIIDTNI